MPELPEVETTRRGLKDHLANRKLRGWTVRNPALRWPVEIPDLLAGESLLALNRRGKYLLFEFEPGLLLLHLGMSGSLRLVGQGSVAAPNVHDHVDLAFGDWTLRLNDPRRFGCVLWQPKGAGPHRLLANLGVEPLGDGLTARYLKDRAAGRRTAVKNFIMDGRILVGVGNIYAAEALFLAGVRPGVAAGRLSLRACAALAGGIKQVLAQAIEAGGTTLRNFVGSDGRPGYFAQQLNVYGRGGKPCRRCGNVLKARRIGGRSTVYCPHCQGGPALGNHRPDPEPE